MSWKDLFRRKDDAPQSPAEKPADADPAPAPESASPQGTAEQRLAEAKDLHKAGRIDEADDPAGR